MSLGVFLGHGDNHATGIQSWSGNSTLHINCEQRESDLHAGTMEQQNDQRLHDLAGKSSSIRQVTNDIYTQASDHGVLDTATDTFGSMMTSIRGGASRLTRAAQAGHPIFKTAGLALAVIFLMYFSVHFFF